MISSVSGVSFGNKVGAMDKISSEQLQTPGMYSSPDVMMPNMQQPRKKGGFLRFLGKLILTAAIVGGALVGAKHLINPEVLKTGITEKSGLAAKAKYYVAKAGDWVETIIKSIPAKFKSQKADAAADAGEAKA